MPPPASQPRQPCSLSRYDDRGGLIAFVRPARRRCLWIEIEQGGLHAPLFGRNRQMDADGRFAGTAFLTDNSDCFHACTCVGCIVCDHTCKHLNGQAQRRQAVHEVRRRCLPAFGAAFCPEKAWRLG